MIHAVIVSRPANAKGNVPANLPVCIAANHVLVVRLENPARIRLIENAYGFETFAVVIVAF